MNRVRGSRVAMSCIAALVAANATVAQVIYRRAHIDGAGELHIIMADGRAIVPRKKAEQVGFDQAAISADHRSIGWLALYPNCCTSYPIPLALVVLTEGKERMFDG